ncbi:MAG: DUF167 domain-containing protein [Alphaproteobacteria bacterium]
MPLLRPQVTQVLLRPHSKGITLTIRLTPGAKQDALLGLMDIADNQRAIKASVTAPPEDGRANKAMIALLAKELKLPKTSISVLSGDTSRQKVLLVEGETTPLLEKINGWISALQARP